MEENEVLKSIVIGSRAGNCGATFGHVHEPALGLDGQIEPRRHGTLARPDACGEDDAVGLDPPAPSLNAGDAAAVDNDPLHRARLLRPRPEPGRPPRAALHDEVGRDEARQAIDDGAAEMVDGELGHDLLSLLRRQHLRVDLGGDVVHEVSLEALQPSDRLEPDANVQLVREERADTTGTVARRTASESAPLKQDRPSAASSAR